MQRTLVIGTLLGMAIASFALFPPAAAALVVGSAALVIATRTWTNLRSLERLRRARAAFDAGAMHRELDRLLSRYGIDPRTRASLRFEKGIAYLIEERYADAAALYRALEQEPLSERNQLARRSNLAWCEAHVGNPEQALADAQAALRDAEQAGEERLGPQVGTVGVAQLKAGRPGEAVPLLERALSLESALPQLRAVHGFYLGEALRELGREAEARSAFERAATEGEGTRWGERAAEALRVGGE